MKYKLKISPFVLITSLEKEKDTYIYSEIINKVINLTPFKIKLEKYHI